MCQPPYEDRLVNKGDVLFDLCGGEKSGLNSPGLGRSHSPAELLHPGLGACDLNTTTGGADTHFLVLILTVESQMSHFLVVINRKNEVGCVTCRPAGVGERALVDLNDVTPTHIGEMMDNGVSDDARSDDNDVG